MNSSVLDDIAFAAGMRTQLAVRRLDRGDFVKYAAASDVLLDVEAESFGRFCSEIACQAFIKSGADFTDPTFARFAVLKSAADWTEAHQRSAVIPVLAALAAVEEDMGMLKQAGDGTDFAAAAGSALAPVFSSAAKLSPTVLRTLFGLAALGGTATGIASWQAGRDVGEDDIPTEIDQSKANYYQLLTHRLREASGRDPIAA